MIGWFEVSWLQAMKVALSTIAIYVTVLVSLRIAGRRTVSQMSAFDFVVTIAIGSLVASTALNPEPTYGRALIGLFTLLAAQQLVAVIRQRIPAAQRLLDFPPEALYREGQVNLRHNPLTAQVTETELLSKLRHHGIASLDEVRLVVLEPDGRVSVLRSNGTMDIWSDVVK